eukprot:CAMPEP_0202843628 /NCGR_PEP_ID=MMETSP1389-20130828/64909_1 /ASSEMBLY_ACC=CAM_ASM_000865 /TAXON_ID=302021 /ORGANISM="Rhodomonas sp., Strain CCMP768" /LENGTH=156 /DNA_ID=CAMNT_0049520789 /DNA_START=135 /DNA_END=602 /DNA_ORIENTATION=+
MAGPLLKRGEGREQSPHPTVLVLHQQLVLCDAGGLRGGVGLERSGALDGLAARAVSVCEAIDSGVEQEVQEQHVEEEELACDLVSEEELRHLEHDALRKVHPLPPQLLLLLVEHRERVQAVLVHRLVLICVWHRVDGGLHVHARALGPGRGPVALE